MKIFDAMSGNITKAVDFVVEKNRKAALINRIRIVIKNERENEARAYVALGKYYYENLRDRQNEETEHLCRAVDFSDARIKKAFSKMDELTAPEGCDEDDCAQCGGDCGYCMDEEPEDFTEKQEGAVPTVSGIVEKANEAEAVFAGRTGEEAAEDEPLDPGV